MSTQAAARTVPYKEKAPFDYSSYMRKGKLPHIWCPGCGHGIVLKSLLRAIHATGMQQNDIAIVSGIGCSSRTPGYVDFNTLHTLHGRALAYATGLKLAKPKLKHDKRTIFANDTAEHDSNYGKIRKHRAGF